MLDAKSKRILVVDDKPGILFLLEYLLEDAGFTNYKTYDNPHDALDSIRTGEKVDIVITDYNMPGMNGAELLNAVYKIDKDIKSVIISADHLMMQELKNEYNTIEKNVGFSEKLMEFVFYN